MYEDPDHRSNAFIHTDLGLSWSSARRALLVLALSVGFVAISVALGPESARRPTVAPLAPPAAYPVPEKQPLLDADIDSCGVAEACAVIAPAAARKGAAAARKSPAVASR